MYLLASLAFIFACSIPNVNAASGVFLFKWGSFGTGDGQFDAPSGVAVDCSGNNIYVVDRNNYRIQKFDMTGSFLLQWGSFGTGNGQFDDPNGVTVDCAGIVYIADEENHRIQKFDADGHVSPQ
jgi:DNA-binding beta-propeller fold protein YncE